MSPDHQRKPRILKRTIVPKNESTGRPKPPRIVKIVRDLHNFSVDDFPPPGFSGDELTITPPLKIARRTSEEVGNYTADMVAKRYEGD